MERERLDAAKARDLAIRRLSRRECSCVELRRYLQRKGAEETLAQAVVDDLVGRGWLDDSRYARMLVRDQLKRGKGAVAISMKLRQKGVALDTREVRAMAEAEGFPDELEAARALITRRYPDIAGDRKEAGRAYQFLLRRGFTHDIALKALRPPAD